MLHFQNDYLHGATEKVLSAIAETNMVPCAGYGEDEISERAKDKIRSFSQAPQADVFFLVGGTQTNQVVIASLLSPCEGVIAVDSGHIAVHEAGAIEVSGHKVITLPGREGKLFAEDVAIYLKHFWEDETAAHMVTPAMVYISHPSEFGTLYTKAELEALRDVCDQYKLYLFMDGARLGYGLAASEADLAMRDISRLTDVFYIGGTKVGALFGEAVVFPKRNAPRQMVSLIKQRGALLAKGRLLGVQFDALMTDDHYMEISRHAIRLADDLRRVFSEKGYRFFIQSPTNQIFVIVSNEKIDALKRHVAFSLWMPWDESHSVLRFVTSWATTIEDITKLADLL